MATKNTRVDRLMTFLDHVQNQLVVRCGPLPLDQSTDKESSWKYLI